MNAPQLISMIEQLIASPSVSSINPGWDQSNQGVIERLSEWMENLASVLRFCRFQDNLENRT